MPVVRVVIPGLEGPGSLKRGYVYGSRAAAVAMQHSGLEILAR